MNTLKGVIVLLMFSFVFLGSCHKETFDTTPETENPGCDTVDYTLHIKPMLDQYCNGCHFAGGPGPGDFTKLENVQAQKDRIKVRAVIEGTMPQAGPMPDAERELLGLWIDCGAIGEAEQNIPSYTTDISPILDTNCVVCHNPRGTAPGDYSVYDDVKNAIDSKNLEGRVFVIQDMPPGGSLTVDERVKLKEWLDGGSPNN